MDDEKKSDARDEKTEGSGFQHNQSAELVEAIRRKAEKAKLESEEPNELGQQPMHEDKAPGLTPQQQREKPRE